MLFIIIEIKYKHSYSIINRSGCSSLTSNFSPVQCTVMYRESRYILGIKSTARLNRA